MAELSKEELKVDTDPTEAGKRKHAGKLPKREMLNCLGFDIIIEKALREVLEKELMKMKSLGKVK